MSWCWLARVPSLPSGVLAAATLTELDGTAAGALAAWAHDATPPEGAAKVDARAVEPNGAPAMASLVLDPAGCGLPFDDPAVSQAIRRTLLARPAEVVSTLVLGDDRFVGALTAVRDGDTGRLADDPFAAVFPARMLQVGEGLLGLTPAPVGPTIQRYGSGNPWPWDRFPTPKRA